MMNQNQISPDLAQLARVRVSWDTLEVPWWDVVKELNNHTVRLTTLTSFALTGFLITAGMDPIKQRVTHLLSLLVAIITKQISISFAYKNLTSGDMFAGTLILLIVAVFIYCYTLIIGLFSIPIVTGATKSQYNQRITDLIDALHSISLLLRGAVSAYTFAWLIALLGDSPMSDGLYIVQGILGLLGVLAISWGVRVKVNPKRLLTWPLEVHREQRKVVAVSVHAPQAPQPQPRRQRRRR